MDSRIASSCMSCASRVIRSGLHTRSAWGRRFLSSQTASPSVQQQPTTRNADLAKIIRDSIKATGPIPLSRYMQLCLSHPTAGYYTRQRPESDDVFGGKGDFITSPEISQVFGELVAIWLITQWHSQGSPQRVRLIELGPGRGTLLDDILRTFLSITSFPVSALQSLILIETSLPLRQQQELKLQERIKTFGGHADNVKVEWVDHVTEVPVDPETFTMVIAHEFFDALPINLFQKTEDGFREVYVNVDQERTSSSSSSSSSPLNFDSTIPATPSTPITPSGLTLALSRTPTTLSQFLPSTSPRFSNMKAGERVEISPDSWNIMRGLGELVRGRVDMEPVVVDADIKGNKEVKEHKLPEDKSAGGAGLVMDYGANGFSSNSFRAFRKHQIVNVFDDPGSADLTANVDFAYLGESLAGVALPHGPINQRDFLISLGLAPRLDRLLQSAPTTERKIDIAQAARRLVDVNGMGGEYKFMGFTPEGVDKVYPFVVEEKK